VTLNHVVGITFVPAFRWLSAIADWDHPASVEEARHIAARCARIVVTPAGGAGALEDVHVIGAREFETMAREITHLHDTMHEIRWRAFGGGGVPVSRLESHAFMRFLRAEVLKAPILGRTRSPAATGSVARYSARMIAFFGMGLLGTGFVRAMRRRGEDVQVWNRTHAKAQRLETEGARAFPDPAECARGAARVHLALSDDAAVDDLIERARIEADAIIVDHTTTSAEGAKARSARWKNYVHAPVFMGPQNALEGTGIMLLSGDRGRFEALRPVLEPMTGKLIYLDERPEAAASFKLLGNMLLMFLTAGFADMLALGKALDVAPSDVGTLLEHFNPGTTLPARLKRVIEARFDEPSWELAMARKDARLMLDEAARGRPLGGAARDRGAHGSGDRRRARRRRLDGDRERRALQRRSTRRLMAAPSILSKRYCGATVAQARGVNL
jgi:3-hydroxyisobutyrate dehydrogenase